MSASVHTDTPTTCTHVVGCWRDSLTININNSTCSLPPSLILPFHHTGSKRTESSGQRQRACANGPWRGASFTAKIRRLLRRPNDLCPIRGNRTLNCLGGTDPRDRPPGEAQGELMQQTIWSLFSPEWPLIADSRHQKDLGCLHINHHSGVSPLACSRKASYLSNENVFIFVNFYLFLMT